MFELEINEKVYQFNFGMRFLKEINRSHPFTDKRTGFVQNVGMRTHFALLDEGDCEALEDVLFCANAGQNPRITREVIDAYIDNEDTDIEGLFEQVMDFLSESNACKKALADMKRKIDARKEKEQLVTK